MKNMNEFLLCRCLQHLKVSKTLCGIEMLLHPSSGANLQLVVQKSSKTTRMEHAISVPECLRLSLK